eukprot:m.6904 g.6904  ORF g.6904 m.6904 type:complete len:573 (-) comp5274_c0_seq2:162-1880(-)
MAFTFTAPTGSLLSKRSEVDKLYAPQGRLAKLDVIRAHIDVGSQNMEKFSVRQGSGTGSPRSPTIEGRGVPTSNARQFMANYLAPVALHVLQFPGRKAALLNRLGLVANRDISQDMMQRRAIAFLQFLAAIQRFPDRQELDWGVALPPVAQAATTSSVSLPSVIPPSMPSADQGATTSGATAVIPAPPATESTPGVVATNVESASGNVTSEATESATSASVPDQRHFSSEEVQLMLREQRHSWENQMALDAVEAAPLTGPPPELPGAVEAMRARRRAEMRRLVEESLDANENASASHPAEVITIEDRTEPAPVDPSKSLEEIFRSQALLPSQSITTYAPHKLIERFRTKRAIDLNWVLTTLVQGSFTKHLAYDNSSATGTLVSHEVGSHKIVSFTQLIRVANAVAHAQLSLHVGLGNHLLSEWIPALTMVSSQSGPASAIAYAQLSLNAYMHGLSVGLRTSMGLDHALVTQAVAMSTRNTNTNAGTHHARVGGFRAHGQLPPDACRDFARGQCNRHPCVYIHYPPSRAYPQHGARGAQQRGGGGHMRSAQQPQRGATPGTSARQVAPSPRIA